MHRELVHGDGLRQRLFDNRDASYWPRLIVTDDDRDDARCPPECYERPPAAAVSGGAVVPRTRLADNLRFLFVGQRARAESLLQQRQPGLIEALVRQQIHIAVWHPDFGRMLFQLMVPPDLKDAARRLERVVLVVDAATANLPWELMLADDPAHPEADSRPLAVRTAVVRQLASSRFRRQVRQGTGRGALVIGNPSVEGFAEAFPDPKRAAMAKDAAPPADPPNLPGAEAEAETVVALLRRMDYQPDFQIGADRSASDVLAALYRKPYRLLHISGHGVFDLAHADGRRRSGVVLSGGLLVTAAEIDAMETVPELVFLNCCHLGQVDSVRDGNRLAASVARELIAIGVRCVVVAGWAVRDDSAQRFGRVFYEQLLLQRLPFGEAVFAARRTVWTEFPQDITWGAFQAYGDAGWRVDPRAGDGAGSDDGTYASLDELLDELARTRAALSRRRDRQDEREAREQVRAIEDKLKKRCPPDWQALPQLQSALGATWRDLGRLEEARAAFRKAVQAEDKAGRVPIKDIEQLANVEARLGERRAVADYAAELAARRTPRQRGSGAGDAAGGEDGADRAGPDAAAQAPGGGSRGRGKEASSATSSDGETALGLIELALRRLDGLDDVVAAGEGAPGRAAPPPNGERSALRGSALKRKAVLHAQQVLLRPAGAQRDTAAKAMGTALEQAVQAYKIAEGDPAGATFLPYNALNRLALDALLPWASPQARDAAVALAEQCRRAVAQSHAREPDLWDAVMQPEARFVGKLLDGSLAADADAGRQAVDEVAQAYADSLSNLTIKPSQLDSVAGQMELLGFLLRALSVAPDGTPEQARLADRLFELARRVQPGRRPVHGLPTPAEAAAAAAAAAADGDDEALPVGDSPPPGGPSTSTDPAEATGAAGTAAAAPIPPAQGEGASPGKPEPTPESGPVAKPASASAPTPKPARKSARGPKTTPPADAPAKRPGPAGKGSRKRG